MVPKYSEWIDETPTSMTEEQWVHLKRMTERRVDTIGSTGRATAGTVIGPRETVYNRYLPEKGPTEIEIDEFIASVKSRGCILCGEVRNLMFIHPNSPTKKIEASDTPHGLSLNRVKAKFSQYMVICARCNRLIHGDTLPQSYIKLPNLYTALQNTVKSKYEKPMGTLPSQAKRPKKQKKQK